MSRVLAYLGLRRPYRFERAVPVVLALALAAMIAGTAAGLVVAGELRATGPRANYFLYLLGLLALVVAGAKWPRVASVLLVLATVEFGWGVGSWALAPAGGPSLLPPAAGEPPRFRWHALLQAVPVPSLNIVSATGLAVRHSSQGTRGRDPATEDLATRAAVATYGGSATYDIGNGEGDTWSDRLNTALRNDGLFVVNHGVPGYTTSELVVQTAFYADTFGKVPRCAVYFVGWNDLRNARIPRLDACTVKKLERPQRLAFALHLLFPGSIAGPHGDGAVAAVDQVEHKVPAVRADRPPRREGPATILQEGRLDHVTVGVVDAAQQAVKSEISFGRREARNPVVSGVARRGRDRGSGLRDGHHAEQRGGHQCDSAGKRRHASGLLRRLKIRKDRESIELFAAQS